LIDYLIDLVWFQLTVVYTFLSLHKNFGGT